MMGVLCWYQRQIPKRAKRDFYKHSTIRTNQMTQWILKNVLISSCLATYKYDHTQKNIILYTYLPFFSLIFQITSVPWIHYLFLDNLSTFSLFPEGRTNSRLNRTINTWIDKYHKLEACLSFVKSSCCALKIYPIDKASYHI